MQKITFITGNQKKADFLAKYLGFPVEHIKLDLDEIQSLDSKEIIEHKVKQAYNQIWWPVLVEDVSLSFSCLWKLPWPFIKFFESELWLERLASIVDCDNRNATASCTFGYFDWIDMHFFEWNVKWKIAKNPRWDWGFWWDRIFIPYWTDRTSAELNEEEYERFYTEEKPFTQIREFLSSSI